MDIALVIKKLCLTHRVHFMVGQCLTKINNCRLCVHIHAWSGNAWLLFASMFRYYCTIGCISARPRFPLSNQTFYPKIAHVTKSFSISLCGLSAQSLNFMSFQHNIVSFKWFCLVFCRPQIHICDKLSGNAWLDSCMYKWSGYAWLLFTSVGQCLAHMVWVVGQCQTQAVFISSSFQLTRALLM